MTRPSGFNERNARICLLLDVAPSLRLRDVAQDLGVTEMTLRRDAALAVVPFDHHHSLLPLHLIATSLERRSCLSFG